MAERVRPALRLLSFVFVFPLFVGALAYPGLTSISDIADQVDEQLLAPIELPDEVPEPALRSEVLAADGSRLGLFIGAEHRVRVELEAVPQILIDAVLVTEDRDFQSHNGVDHRAIARAFAANVRGGEIQQGGSTITQQLVKNLFLDARQTVARKVREAITAVELERRLSKEQILERYLNAVYLGNGVYGVGTATRFYFDKSLEELEPQEAALLAGLISSPERTDPIEHPERATERRNVVLDLMARYDVIGREEADRLASAPLALTVTPPPPPREPFFVEYVKQRLLDDDRLGETREDRARRLFSGGLTISTTLQPKVQSAAVQGLLAHIDDPLADPLGGVVSIEPGTGRIAAMAVAPKPFGECEDGEEPCLETNVNPLVPGSGGSGRQAGSSFKPVVLATALEHGRGTDTAFRTRGGQEVGGERCETDGEPWEPENYAPTSRAWMDMPEAIRVSNNVYHARLAADLGPERVVDMAHQLGIRGDLPAVCSLGLGSADIFPIDLASAYTTFANGGERCEPFAVESIADQDGEVLLRNAPDCRPVLQPQNADAITTMLTRVIEGGTGTAADIGRPAAGKTGTTDDWRDAWFVGYVPQLTTAVWVGYEQPEPMIGVLGYRRVAGGTAPAAIWHDVMLAALEDVEPLPLPSVTLERADGPPEELESPSPAPTPTLLPLSPPPPPTDAPEPEPTDTRPEEPSPQPSPSPSPQPSPSPSPEPDPEPIPDDPLPEPTDDPSPSPEPSPTEEPSPSPSPTEEAEATEPSPSPSPTEGASSAMFALIGFAPRRQGS
ncbi:MAG: transglycosylase domain-containing protein [Actinobacteria bacterium]|nr:transglycosylase domain-containing protein [Actinomycetota bacterium]